MATVLNSLNCKNIGPCIYYWFLLGIRNRIHHRTFLLELQKAAIREDPGSFREEKREGETAEKLFLSKHRNPGRSGKIPGSETGRETPTFRKPAVREVPGRFREGFREGVGALKSCFYAVSLRFPDTIFPQSGPCVYGK